jgi:hypothetical protein
MKEKNTPIQDWKERNKMQLDAAVTFGIDKGGKSFMKTLNTYKTVTGLLLVFGTIFAMISKQWLVALILFGITHLHLLVNQIFWKIKTIEKILDERKTG